MAVPVLPSAGGARDPAAPPLAGQRLSAPTRVLFGADDFYIPLALLEEVEAHGDDLTLNVITGCSHWMPEERPDLIAEKARALFG